MKRPEYIRFTDVASPGKTRRVLILTTRSNAQLGEINWYGPWRQYVFRPKPDTIFNHDCMSIIARRVKEMTDEHRDFLRKEVTGE